MSEESMDTGIEPVDTNTEVTEQPQLTEQQQEQIRRYKVKVNNEELEVDEDELVRGYQTRKAADEKFREAAMARKQAEEFISLLKNEEEVFNVLAKLGYDPKDLSEKYLVKQLEEELLSPEEKELRDYKRKLAQYEAEKKAEQERIEQEQRLELINKFTNDYQTQIIDALETSGLPKTQHTVKRMSYYMHQALQRGYDLTAKDVVHLVREDYIQEQKALFGNLDGEKLVELLGKETADKIRKHGISKIKKVSQEKPKVVKPVTKHQKKKSKEQFLEEIRNKYK